MSDNFSIIDGVILFIFLVSSLGLGLYFSKKSDSSTNEYFLAGRNIGWLAIGLSIFATNISSEHFIGLAGSGAARGLAVGQFELMAIFTLILLGWIIAPIYLKSGVVTLPEYLEKRFNAKIRKLFAWLSILIYLFTKISVSLFAGGILFSNIFGVNIYASAIFIVLITGLYTLFGGANAVIRTNIYQGILLIIGAMLLTIFGLREVGGFEGLTNKLPSDYFNMFKPISDPDFPWTGILFGAPIIAFWYWCTDQYIVQKLFSAKGLNDARRGTLFAAILKISPVFILVLPGLIAAVLYPEVKGDNAYPTLLASNLLPAGIKGIVLAGLLGAIMSSLSSVFNVTAMLYTNDIYKPRHPGTSENELVLVGRITTIVIVFAAILCVPLVRQLNSQIYLYLQSIQAYLGPPIASIFLLGLSFKIVNASGAIWGLIIGESIGLSRLFTDMIVNSNLSSSSVLIGYSQINFLHFAILIFIVSSAAVFLGSYLTEKKSEPIGCNKNISVPGLWNMSSELNTSTLKVSKTNLVISAFIILIIFGMWSIWY